MIYGRPRGAGELASRSSPAGAYLLPTPSPLSELGWEGSVAAWGWTCPVVLPENGKLKEGVCMRGREGVGGLSPVRENGMKIV